jgi:hypothetical protein
MLTCDAVDGDKSAFELYLRLAAKAAEEWRRMGKPDNGEPDSKTVLMLLLSTFVVLNTHRKIMNTKNCLY